MKLLSSKTYFVRPSFHPPFASGQLLLSNHLLLALVYRLRSQIQGVSQKKALSKEKAPQKKIDQGNEENEDFCISQRGC